MRGDRDVDNIAGDRLHNRGLFRAGYLIQMVAKIPHGSLHGGADNVQKRGGAAEDARESDVFEFFVWEESPLS